MLPDRGEEPLLPLRQRQCLILLDSGFLKTEHLLWLDGLYLRVTGEDHMALQVIDVLPPPPGQNIPMTKVWMVDVTIQGDANTNAPPHTGLISGISGTRASILAQRESPPEPPPLNLPAQRFVSLGGVAIRRLMPSADSSVFSRVWHFGVRGHCVTSVRNVRLPRVPQSCVPHACVTSC